MDHAIRPGVTISRRTRQAGHQVVIDVFVTHEDSCLMTFTKSNSDVVSCGSLRRISLDDEECIMRVIDCPDCDCRMSWKLLEDHQQPHGLKQVQCKYGQYPECSHGPQEFIGCIEEMRRTLLKWSEVQKQEVVVHDLVLLGTWHDDVVVSDSGQFFMASEQSIRCSLCPIQLPRNECENRAATCENCNMNTTYRKLQTHMTEECPESLGCRPFRALKYFWISFDHFDPFSLPRATFRYI